MFTLDLEFDLTQNDVDDAVASFRLDDFNVAVNYRELEPVERQTELPVVRFTCEKYMPLRVIAAYYDRTYALYSDSAVDFIVES